MPIAVAYFNGMPVLSPSDVLNRLSLRNFFVFDTNPQHVFIHHRVPGAMHLDPADFTESQLPRDEDAALLFYSSGPLCGKGTHAARRALRMGYNKVYVMTEGITGWIRAGCPVEKG
jgi:rhodanese-related sulfurtransferase